MAGERHEDPALRAPVAEVAGQRVEAALPGRQGRLLFAYLAANRARMVTRPELVEVLWPGGAPDAAETALASLLSKVSAGRRRAAALDGKAELRLSASSAEAWVDLEAAGVGVHRAESAVALGEWERAWAPARTALYIANRGLLPGYEAPWIDERRRWLEDVRLRALECVGHGRPAHGRHRACRGRDARAGRSSRRRRSGRAVTGS